MSLVTRPVLATICGGRSTLWTAPPNWSEVSPTVTSRPEEDAMEIRSTTDLEQHHRPRAAPGPDGEALTGPAPADAPAGPAGARGDGEPGRPACAGVSARSSQPCANGEPWRRTRW
ncbi:hypothetical protein [Geodermatophilus sp. CPCC 205506]|uniref:hypothetical protein n=1 Tax=Geodermatophilus sp. CPCC 205506 TaxID=2936596 RepID=UPI003EE8E5BD